MPSQNLRTIVAFILVFILVIPVFLHTADSQLTQRSLNAIFNPDFESAGDTSLYQWEPAFPNQASRVFTSNTTMAHGGTYSGSLVALPCASCYEESAFIGQNPLSWDADGVDYSIANIADSSDSLSFWAHIQLDGSPPYSLRIRISLTGYNIEYIYGEATGVGNVTGGNTLVYKLGDVPVTAEGEWFPMRRNLYRDFRPFNVANATSIRIIYFMVGAVSNQTLGETVWVDDVSLLYNPPSAEFKPTQPSQRELRIVFDASDSTPSLGASFNAYRWNFGDGETGADNAPSMSHIYSAEGAYQVTLKVEDDKGRIATTSQIVLVLGSDGGNSPFNPLAAYATGMIMILVFALAIFLRRFRRRRH